EVGPGVTGEKLALLKERKTTRISIGVQSFSEEENRALCRFQEEQTVYKALESIVKVGFDILNIDLIYGIPGQTCESWLFSIRQALRFEPDEIYLYPIYIRPLTPLGTAGRVPGNRSETFMLTCYTAARDFLLDNGYRQSSMRKFYREKQAEKPVSQYSCQEDGMIGLGCGARSYTWNLHYSSAYAVTREGTKQIIEDYINSPSQSFGYAFHGIKLNREEQKRRYLLKSLLHFWGLDLASYYDNFKTVVFDDFPQLDQLLEFDLAFKQGERLYLSKKGFQYSDAIGPWLISPAVRFRGLTTPSATDTAR
ncbi:MAG: radical SAM protein, partial [bacterium]|nr:radical SAM protein [bacterium]